ncbi:endolytic transglycosylase MltG [Streptococcus suis]|uniref:endolytic transglycosylase MltG n=1 Tax=Streptococcus suis TaxID=1307 RepID=UPI001ABE5103|nr:endolytic transglycosylase MltG [Streptococcus suis]
MSNDSKEKNTQSSNFREQILRDLEELKQKRLREAQGQVQTESIDLQPEPLVEDHLPVEEIVVPEPVAVDEAVLPGDQPVTPIVEELGEPAVKIDTIAFEEEVPVVVKQSEPSAAVTSVDATSSEARPEFDNTVERNISELRSMAENFERSVPSPIPVSDPVVESLEATPQAVGETELDKTIVPPVPAGNSQMAKTDSETPRRRSTKQVRKKKDKAAKRIVSVVMLVTVLALILTAVSGYFYVKSSLEPINASATETVQVEIPEGSSTKKIAEILQDNNLIKNATIFNYYSKLKSYNNFQSGFYNLSQSMSVDDLAKALQEGGTPVAEDPIAGKVLVVEGYTLEQISKSVTDNVYTDDTTDTTPFTAEEFMATVQNQDFIARMVAAYPTLFASLPAADSGVKYQLEGYLFPATYDYTADTTVEGLIEQMIAAMDANLKPYYESLAAKGLDVNSVLTMASLVEKEGSTDEDRRNIASVFYNRINAGIPLQSNIAILYAMGMLGQETTLAQDAAIDTAIDSPYNIYVNYGLMPGPVDSPSLSAIEATVNPNTTDYYYFVADVTTGTVYFTNSYEEHLVNVETYVNSKLNN